MSRKDNLKKLEKAMDKENLIEDLTKLKNKLKGWSTNHI